LFLVEISPRALSLVLAVNAGWDVGFVDYADSFGARGRVLIEPEFAHLLDWAKGCGLKLPKTVNEE
jgi:hypothetical protein